MKKHCFLLIALAGTLLLLSLSACQKTDCDDPWGLVGSWTSVERTLQYRDGVPTTDIPGSWRYTFVADGTGVRENGAFTFPFEWFYARATEQLIITEPFELAPLTRSFSLTGKTDISLSFRDSSFLNVPLPPDFTQTERLTTVHTLRLLSE
jgi:hypothetical protein